MCRCLAQHRSQGRAGLHEDADISLSLREGQRWFQDRDRLLAAAALPVQRRQQRPHLQRGAVAALLHQGLQEALEPRLHRGGLTLGEAKLRPGDDLQAPDVREAEIGDGDRRERLAGRARFERGQPGRDHRRGPRGPAPAAVRFAAKARHPAPSIESRK